MADGDKLVKAGVEAAMKPFADLLDKLAGPAAEEIGLTLRDHVRVFRLKREVRLCQRVSIEETDELQDIWANMLANAAAGGNGGSGVEPVFPLILKELGIQEVKFLDELYE